MIKYMFGLDKDDYVGSAKKLVELGYDGVVLSVHAGEAAFSAAKDAGLEVWACFGAHYIGSFSKEEYGAVTAGDKPAPWFGSACPNAKEVNEHNLNKAFDAIANIPYISGMFVDGARFASFASTEGIDSFFSCFCPRCMKKMGKDAKNIKNGIEKLSRLSQVERSDLPTIRYTIDKWFDFRAACVKEYMDAFTLRCHKRGIKAGAFVFAQTLSRYVGQTPYALSSLDVVAPMLYRAYPHEDGVACLSHEWAALTNFISEVNLPSYELTMLLFQTWLPPFDLMRGFSPTYVADEIARARAKLSPNIKLLPIIQTEDELLSEVYKRALNAGADGCGEFAYSLKEF